MIRIRCRNVWNSERINKNTTFKISLKGKVPGLSQKRKKTGNLKNTWYYMLMRMLILKFVRSDKSGVMVKSKHKMPPSWKKKAKNEYHLKTLAKRGKEKGDGGGENKNTKTEMEANEIGNTSLWRWTIKPSGDSLERPRKQINLWQS